MIRPRVARIYFPSLKHAAATASNVFKRRSEGEPDLRVGVRSVQEQLPPANVVPLLRMSMLPESMKVAQPPLQRRSFIQGAAAAQREAGVCRTNAGGGHPYRSLCALHEKRI